MNKSKLSPEDIAELEEWLATKDDIKAKASEIITNELTNKEPVILTREHAWGVGAVGIILIVLLWPALIVGMVLGAFGWHKLTLSLRKIRNKD